MRRPSLTAIHEACFSLADQCDGRKRVVNASMLSSIPPFHAAIKYDNFTASVHVSHKSLHFFVVSHLLFQIFINIRFLIKLFCSTLRSVDTTVESKQFQELLLERTKALAAQTEALKSVNSDGKFWTIAAFLDIVCDNENIFSILLLCDTLGALLLLVLPCF